MCLNTTSLSDVSSRGRAFFVFAKAKIRQKRKISTCEHNSSTQENYIFCWVERFRANICSEHCSLLGKGRLPANWLYSTSLVLIKRLTAWGTKETADLQQSYRKRCTWLFSSSFSWCFWKSSEQVCAFLVLCMAVYCSCMAPAPRGERHWLKISLAARLATGLCTQWYAQAQECVQCNHRLFVWGCLGSKIIYKGELRAMQLSLSLCAQYNW